MTSTANLKAWAALIVAVAVAGCLLAVLVATKPAEAAGRYKTVTKTFQNTSSIIIPAGAPTTAYGPASPYPSASNALGLKRGKIKDVNVTLRTFEHTCPDDVDVLLVGPRGQNAIIMSDVGGCSVTPANGLTLGLDDEAAGSLPDNGQLSSGTFKPTNAVTLGGNADPFTGAPAPGGAVALSTFDGTNPNGTWSLYVYDDADQDTGQFFGGWSLQIKARVLR